MKQVRWVCDRKLQGMAIGNTEPHISLMPASFRGQQTFLHVTRGCILHTSIRACGALRTPPSLMVGLYSLSVVSLPDLRVGSAILLGPR
jgi:hypothetical protein